jgi:hypothetical protein
MKTLLTALTILIGSTLPAMAAENNYTVMISSSITTAFSARVAPQAGKVAFQARGLTSAGSGAATVIIAGSNDGENWITIGTITLVLSTAMSSDGFTSDSGWRYFRANLSAISGTNATVLVAMAGRQ